MFSSSHVTLLLLFNNNVLAFLVYKQSKSPPKELCIFNLFSCRIFPSFRTTTKKKSREIKSQIKRNNTVELKGHNDDTEDKATNIHYYCIYVFVLV